MDSNIIKKEFFENVLISDLLFEKDIFLVQLKLLKFKNLN